MPDFGARDNTSVQGEQALVHERFEDYRNAQTPWAIQAALDLEYESGRHWDETIKKNLEDAGHFPVVINRTWQLVDLAVSLFTARHPRYAVTPVEDSDLKDANLRNQLLTHIWNYNRGTEKLKRVAHDYYACGGRGVWLCYVDPDADDGKGEIIYEWLDGLQVFPDPHSREPDWSDAQSIIVFRLLNKEQVKQRWDLDLDRVPFYNGDNAYFETGKSSNGAEMIWEHQVQDVRSHEKFQILEEYSQIKIPFHRIFNPDTGDEETMNEVEYRERIQAPAYILTTQGESQGITSPDRVAQMDDLYENYGLTNTDGVYHMEQAQLPPGAPPEMAQQLPPVLVPGPERGLPQEIPGSTTKLTPVKLEDLIELNFVPHEQYKKTQIRVAGFIGGLSGTRLYEPFIMPVDQYPIIPTLNGHSGRTPYSISDVHRVRDLQNIINKSTQLQLTHAANSTNLKVFVPRGSISNKEKYESEWGMAGTAFIEYDADPSLGPRGGIEIAAPPPLPGDFYAIPDRCTAMMEQILGIFSLMQGDPSSAPPTHQGTISIDEMGLRRIKSKMDDIYGGLQRLAQVSLQLIPKVYTREKIIRIVQPSGFVEEVAVNLIQYDDYGLEIERLNDTAKGKYDVIIVAGSTLPSNRWALLRTYMDMFQMGIVDDIAVLQHTDLPDAHKIIARKSQLAQMQNALEQAEQQIKGLKGDLQTSQRAEVNALKRLEVGKVKADLKVEAGRMNRASEVFQNSLQSESKVIKERMKNEAKNGSGGNNSPA